MNHPFRYFAIPARVDFVQIFTIGKHLTIMKSVTDLKVVILSAKVKLIQIAIEIVHEIQIEWKKVLIVMVITITR